MHASRLRLPALALCLWIAGLAAPSQAVDYRVTRYDDPVPGSCLATDCSLREATIAASATNSSDRILLSAGKYDLSRAGIDEDAGLTGDLDVRGDVEILGAGATMTVIDAHGLDRVLDFDVFGGSSSAKLEDVEITGGQLPGGGGGAISMAIGADLTIERSEIHDNNNAGNSLGAIKLNIGSLLIVRDSTIRNNLGGGIVVVQGEVQLFNTTFSNNDGVELDMNEATGYCNHCTFRDTTPSASSEISVVSNGDLQIANTALIGECFLSSGGTITSFGGNLESPGAGCDFDQPTDQDGVASHGFGTLADNGGPTSTYLPSVVSPAVGGANDSFCPPTDQRGATRPATNCDVGAVERVLVRPRTPILADGFEQRSAGAWSLVQP